MAAWEEEDDFSSSSQTTDGEDDEDFCLKDEITMEDGEEEKEEAEEEIQDADRKSQNVAALVRSIHNCIFYSNFLSLCCIL